MPSGTYVNVNCIKSFSKLVSKRFALKLSVAQQVVCQASGYSGFNEVYARYDADEELERLTPTDQAAWQRRLGFALGSDLEQLFNPDELGAWFRRVHGILRGLSLVVFPSRFERTH